MDTGRATDNADCQRNFQRPTQIAVVILPPLGHAGVLSAACGVSVRPGFEGAPVVARRNRHRVDPVHDAFVVRRRAVGIDCRERARLDNRPRDLIAAQIAGGQLLRRDHPFDSRFAAVSQVAQDAQVDPPARERLRSAAQDPRPRY